MSKICIPFSGGINSSYSLYRWLSETDHEIIALYCDEQWADQQRRDQEAAQANVVADWLKSNVRDFKLHNIGWPKRYVEEAAPLRAGFEATMNVGIVKPRYYGYAKIIKLYEPDAIVVGISLENTAVDTYQMFRHLFETPEVDIYLSGVEAMEPVAQGDEFDWEAVAASMIGRFEQLEALPAGLLDVINVVDPTQADNPWSLRWAYKRAYDAFVAQGKTGKEFDLWCAQKGNYGPWRSVADPLTQGYRCAGEESVFDYLKQVEMTI